MPVLAIESRQHPQNDNEIKNVPTRSEVGFGIVPHAQTKDLQNSLGAEDDDKHQVHHLVKVASVARLKLHN